MLALHLAPAAHRSSLLPVADGQHGWASPPQVVQVPDEQSIPLLQVCEDPQHGCPMAPHPEHVPAVHIPAGLPVLPPVALVQALLSATHLVS